MQQVRAGASWSGGERNRLFLHRGLTPESVPLFADVSAVSGVDFLDDARSIGLTDWDQDGDLDVWLRNRTAPRLRLMLNQHRGVGPASAATGKQDAIALRLRGTKSNRDAIGAQVTVTLGDQDDARPLLRTLRAGGAFLSQSSKWIHLGLGDEGGAMAQLSVRWPDGTVERFDPVPRGGRYLLVEGHGKAQPVAKRPAEILRLVPPASRVRPNAGRKATASVIFPRKIPLPPIASLPDHRRPLWLMFWSGTCPHCREDLEAVASARQALQEAGLDVLALAVDPDDDSAGSLMKTLQFPFPWAMAEPETLSLIHSLQAGVFDQTPPDVVPLHLLIDRETSRSMVALFRGTVKPSTMINALPLTTASDGQLRGYASPYAGQWYTKPQPSESLLAFLGEKLQRQHPEASAFYYEKAGMQARAARLFYQIAMEGGGASDPNAAESALQKAVELDPSFGQAHNNLGALLANQGRLDEAHSCFQNALRHDPGNEKARLNLKLLQKMRQP